jgi:predicted glycosyltransferase
MTGMASEAVCDSPPARRRRSARPKVLLYSHDTFGLGHLRRNLAIATHLLQRNQPFAVRLLTGSPVAGSWPMPAGLEVQALPPVVKTGAEEYAARDRSSSFAAVRMRRVALILQSVLDYRPDVLLVDHAPAGMKSELLGALAFIRAEMPHTRTVLGLRDIVDSPKIVRQLWRDEGIYALLDSLYDQILVYGNWELFDAVHEYGLPDAVAAKARYCGYVVEAAPETAAAASARVARSRSARQMILVTAGGGGDGFPLLQAYLQALGATPHGAAESVLVTGPLMDPEQRRTLENLAAPRRDVRLIDHSTELTELIRGAALVVAMAGYNTTAEILAAKKPAILVPRPAPRAEQRLRATLIAALGLAWVVQPEEDLVVRLRALVQGALAGQRPEGLERRGFDLAGTRRIGDALDALLQSETASIEATP